jgi:hypothetical protein
MSESQHPSPRRLTISEVFKDDDPVLRHTAAAWLAGATR